MPPIGLPGGGGGLDLGGLLGAGARGLDKILPFLPAFQTRVGNFDVNFDPQQAQLQRLLAGRLGGGNRPTGLLGLLSSLSQQDSVGETPPVPQTPTTEPEGIGPDLSALSSLIPGPQSLGLQQPLGFLQGLTPQSFGRRI